MSVVLNSEKMPVWFGGLRQVQGRWVGGAQTPCADPVMANRDVNAWPKMGPTSDFQVPRVSTGRPGTMSGPGT